MRSEAELKEMLGALSPAETQALRESIAAEGVREPIVLWSRWTCPDCGEVVAPRDTGDEWVCENCGHRLAEQEYEDAEASGTIVDGYNRAGIAAESEISCPVRFVTFTDKEEAKSWIARNQLGRRNIGPYKASYCIGILYDETKPAQGGTGANQHREQTGQNVRSANTADAIAAEFGVNEKTIRRDGQFAEAVDALEEIAPGTRAKALNGEIPKSSIMEAGKSLKSGDADAAKRKLSAEERQELNRRADESVARREREKNLVVPVGTLLEILNAVGKHLDALPDDSRRVESLHEIIKVCRAKSIEIQQGRLA